MPSFTEEKRQTVGATEIWETFVHLLIDDVNAIKTKRRGIDVNQKPY